MNCESMQEHWDAARDGELSPHDRARFEQHLQACPRCQGLWQAETHWLSSLANVDADLAAGDEAQQFASQVMQAHAQAVTEAESSQATLVLQLRAWLKPALGLAAAVAVAASVWTASSVSRPPVQPVVVAPPDTVSKLVSELGSRYDSGTRIVASGLAIRNISLKWENVVELLEPLPVPDPAVYIQ